MGAQRTLEDSGMGLSWGRPPLGPGELGVGTMAPPGIGKLPSSRTPFLVTALWASDAALGPSEPKAKFQKTSALPSLEQKPLQPLLQAGVGFGGLCPSPPILGSQEAGTSVPWGLGSPVCASGFLVPGEGPWPWPGPRPCFPQHSSCPLWVRDSKPHSF